MSDDNKDHEICSKIPLAFFNFLSDLKKLFTYIIFFRGDIVSIWNAKVEKNEKN